MHQPFYASGVIKLVGARAPGPSTQSCSSRIRTKHHLGILETHQTSGLTITKPCFLALRLIPERVDRSFEPLPHAQGQFECRWGSLSKSTEVPYLTDAYWDDANPPQRDNCPRCDLPVSHTHQDPGGRPHTWSVTRIPVFKDCSLTPINLVRIPTYHPCNSPCYE